MAIVELAGYDLQWPQMYRREAERIQSALGERALQIEHAGSTAVPGLAAKPVIDIVLVVASSADEASYRSALETAGYVLRIREPEWFEHRMFNSLHSTVNLHVFSKGCPEIERMLDFRDWLRSNADDRELYRRAKVTLAGQSWNSVQDYADAKSAVVQEISERARRQRTEYRDSTR
jgi:GrpB-like predicted nucleotidyltransferase (UPF0157 family)